MFQVTFPFLKRLFKFQYDNTLSEILKREDKALYLFKFQYDNTLSAKLLAFTPIQVLFKFQYDNTLSKKPRIEFSKSFHLNSNMIIL